MACRKVIGGSAGVGPNMLEEAKIVCDKVVETESSHHSGPGSTTG